MSGLADVLRAELGDRYRLDGELGRGGMATVYLAQDLRHERPVAVKVLHPSLGESVGADRFLREIRLAARLTHPNILPVFDSGEIHAPGAGAPVLYYVMPYVSGESLRARLERERQLPLADAVRITSSMAAALDYAHSQGVVHRDVKPENILLEAGEAVLADLGIARAIDVAGGERLTETGIGIGTPAYMSPEQVAAERHVDGRSDQYSLACVAYEMLAGEPPFTGGTAQAVMVRRVTEPPPRLSPVRDGCPPAMDAVLARAMARTPADRFASAGEFAREFAAAAGGPATRPVGGAAPRQRGGSAVRRAVVGGVAAAILLVVAAVMLLRTPPAAIAGPASVMAVVPLTPSTPDTVLERLGRDLVVTISQTLDGIGEVRAVDAQTVLLKARDLDGGGLARARRIAADLGAGAVLHGSLVRVGTLVRADVMLATADSGAPLARVSVSAPADSIGAFTDSIARGVLRQVWRGGEAPSPSLDVAMRTRSFDALRAFLAGEQLAVRNDWAAAADAYAAAIEADSTLWLAYWRLAYALGWHGEPVDSAVTAALAAHAAELPARERLLAEATLRVHDSASAAIGRLRELTTQYPEYWFGWLVYADYITHFGSAVGIPRREGLVAFQRTVTLNSNLLPAWEHYAWLALLERDTAAASRALAGLRPFGPAIPQTVGWDEYASLALTDRLIRGDSAGAARLMSRYVADLAGRADPSFGATALVRHAFPADQLAATRRILAAGPPPPAIAQHRSALMRAFAQRGAWDSVFSMFGDEGQPPLMGGASGAYRLAVLAALMEAVPAAVADQRRPAAVRSTERDPLARAELAWLDGVLAFSRGDSAALSNAGAALAAQAAGNAPLLRRSLAALDRGLRGEREAAAHELAAIEWHRAERGYVEAAPHPALLAVNRLVAARWLAAAGENAEAARLLDWVDGAYTTFAGGELNAYVMPIVTYERGRIAEADGRTRDAAGYYREFLRIYDRPPSLHTPLLRHAAEFIGQGPAA